jgi:hypothetical protein
MATPRFEPVKDNQELLDVIDVCLKSFADKSEKRIELIPGGKYSCRLKRVSVFIYGNCYCHAVRSITGDGSRKLFNETPSPQK